MCRLASGVTTKRAFVLVSHRKFQFRSQSARQGLERGERKPSQFEKASKTFSNDEAERKKLLITLKSSLQKENQDIKRKLRINRWFLTYLQGFVRVCVGLSVCREDEVIARELINRWFGKGVLGGRPLSRQTQEHAHTQTFK